MAKLTITQNTKWLPRPWKRGKVFLNYIELGGLKGEQTETFEIAAGRHTLTIGGSYMDHSLPFEFEIAKDKSKSFQLFIDKKPFIAYRILMISNLFFWIFWIPWIKEALGPQYFTNISFTILGGFGLPAVFYMIWFMIARSEQLFFFQENKNA